MFLKGKEKKTEEPELLLCYYIVVKRKGETVKCLRLLIPFSLLKILFFLLLHSYKNPV